MRNDGIGLGGLEDSCHIQMILTYPLIFKPHISQRYSQEMSLHTIDTTLT